MFCPHALLIRWRVGICWADSIFCCNQRDKFSNKLLQLVIRERQKPGQDCVTDITDKQNINIRPRPQIHSQHSPYIHHLMQTINIYLVQRTARRTRERKDPPLSVLISVLFFLLLVSILLERVLYRHLMI